MKEGRFRLDIRKKFFTITVVKSWHRLSREVGGAPSQETFKSSLDGALSNLVWLKMSLLSAGVWIGWPLRSLPTHSTSLRSYELYLTACLCGRAMSFAPNPMYLQPFSEDGHQQVLRQHTAHEAQLSCCAATDAQLSLRRNAGNGREEMSTG